MTPRVLNALKECVRWMEDNIDAMGYWGHEVRAEAVDALNEAESLTRNEAMNGHANERSDQFFEDVLKAADGTEYEVTIWYTIREAKPRQQIMLPYPEVSDVIMNDGGAKLPDDVFDELEDDIYKRAEQHLRNLPSLEDTL